MVGSMVGFFPEPEAILFDLLILERSICLDFLVIEGLVFEIFEAFETVTVCERFSCVVGGFFRVGVTVGTMVGIEMGMVPTRI
jgi:cytochrome bd-type quinol oxidase subunit 2